MTAYVSAALACLASRHTLDVIERVQAGQTGCVTCGNVSEHSTYINDRTRRCPSCGVDINASGYVDGDFFVRGK